MNWNTIFLGIIAFSHTLLILATVAVAVAIWRLIKQVKGSLAVVEKEAVSVLRQVQGTAKEVTDLTSTAKRFTEEGFWLLVRQRLGRPAAGAKSRGGAGRGLFLAGLALGGRLMRSCRARRKAREAVPATVPDES